MDPVAAPSSTTPFRSREQEEEEHHEKKPVMKKVMDKVKKIKKVIGKKTPGHGNGGDDDDHLQHGDEDEGDEEFEEEEEINTDPANHGHPTAGVNENQAKPRFDPETNKGFEQTREYENPATGLRTGANQISGGGEVAERGGEGLGLITEKFVGDLAPPGTEAEANSGIEQSREGVGDDLGVIKEDIVEDPALQLNSRIEQSRVNLSPKTGSRGGLNDLSGGVGESAERVGDDLGVINMELVEDPAAPKAEAELNTHKEQSQGGEEIEVSPELSRSLEAMALSTQNDRGETELSKDKSSSYTGMVSSAASKVYEKMADAGSAVISKVKPGGEEVDASPELSRSREAITVSSQNDGGEIELPQDQNSSYTSMVTSAASKVYEKMADAGTAVISKVKPDARTEEGDNKAVEKHEVDASPELSRSLDALTISSQNDRGEAKPLKDQNSSYTSMVSSAASKAYGIVADAGTAVISKVKPEAKKEGEDEAVDKQSKGISIKDYITEKLTPGEDEKALSELITEAGQKRKNETVELPPPEKTGSGEAGSGVGVVGRIRETVSSFLGGGGGSPKSPATEAQRKVIEEDKDFHGRPAEAISQEKRSKYENPATGLRTGANQISGGGVAERGGDGLGLITEKFVGDLAPPGTEAEANSGIEQRREGVGDDLGVIKEDFVEDPALQLNSRIEQSRVNLSPKSGSRGGLNDLSGGVGESAERVGDDLGVINMELVEDPAAPKTEAELNTQKDQSRGGEEIEVSPELSRSLEAMALSTQNDGGETELSKDKSSSYTGMVSSAASKVYEKMADAGSAVISKVKPGGEQFDASPEHHRSLEAMNVSSHNDGGETELPKDQNSSYTGMVTSAASKVYEKMADAGTAVISKVKPDARTEEGDDKAVEKHGGTEVDASPELSRSPEELTISSQNDRGETEPLKDQNNSYTGMVSSAASKAYGMVADAGTAVISKVKPDAKKEGEDEAVDKQSKGISIKDYITEKLTPGEDEKALSELITEAGQKRKNETVELPPPEKTGSGETGSGVGVVGRIRETVSSFLGGGGGSPKSPATEAQRKVIEEDKDFHGRPAEAISQEKRSSEELPTSYH